MRKLEISWRKQERKETQEESSGKVIALEHGVKDFYYVS